LRKKIAVLGSTGSIGKQTLEVVAHLPHLLEVVALAAGRNSRLLAEQARQFHPTYTWWDSAGKSTTTKMAATRVLPLEEMATLPEVDIVVMAIGGRVGLSPTLAALKSGKMVAMANKEVLVMAGHLIHPWRSQLLPLDSEHSSLWQCLLGEDIESIERLTITASGGALRDLSETQLTGVTPEQVLRHPTWKMGQKITVDSATLMNKGLEVIETHVLFGTPYDKIDVLLHRESIVHALVEFVDGAQKAALSMPDMRLPIQFALTFPSRLASPTHRLDLRQIGQLSFAPVDWRRYPCLGLAIEAGRRGADYPAVVSAADEVAVDSFLKGLISYNWIPSIVEQVMGEHSPTSNPDIAAVLAADEWATRKAKAFVTARRGLN
jgi:1-deoxy-D-xylulose-5-phosphate reductoisomerase